MRLVHQSTGAVLARHVEVALTRASRRRGLLGRAALEDGAALILAPCVAVHTAFMRFPIDVVFVDRQGIVTRVAALAPWRAAAHFGAAAVVELAAGAARDIRAGDRLYLLDRSGEPGASASPFSSASLRRTASMPACSGS